jgi:hypothetical protein
LSDAVECVRRLSEAANLSYPERRVFDWGAIEGDLGLPLPTDYKLLADSFPEGWFRRFIRLRRPVPWPDGRVRLMSKFALEQLESMREYRETGEVAFPYPLFPEPEGVLPWGSISSPGVAFWLTGSPDPDEWPVVVATEECDYWDRFDGTTCEFLIAVANARYDASRFMTAAFDDQELRKPSRPIDLSEQPVFERPRPRPTAQMPSPVPPPDFWPQRLQEVSWDQLPVNEVDVVRELAGPPSPGVRPVDWAAVHARLGFTLPADYRAFIDIFGPGTFGDIRIGAPGAPGEMDLFVLLERKYGQVRDLRRGVRGAPFYPEPGGTVCCGETTGGYTIGWAPVRPDPDLWTVAVFAPTPTLGTFRFRANISFTTMLRQHAEQRPGMEGGLLRPRDPPTGPVMFTPYISD